MTLAISAIAAMAISDSCAFAADCGLHAAIGEILEVGDWIALRTWNPSSADSKYIFFEAGKPLRYEKTTGLRYSGYIYPSQTVELIYSGELREGQAKAELLFFNPDSEAAANFRAVLGKRKPCAINEAFFSSDGEYEFIFTPDTSVTTSNGDPASPAQGQSILAWFDGEASSYSKKIVLNKAVILLMNYDPPPEKPLAVSKDGEIIFDDGPIATLTDAQLEFYNENGMLPVRKIAESIGYTVDWMPNSTVTLRKGGDIIVFDIGENHYQVNSQYSQTEGSDFERFMDRAMADMSFIARIAEFGH
jgi:hypothetical protein